MTHATTLLIRAAEELIAWVTRAGEGGAYADEAGWKRAVAFGRIAVDKVREQERS